MRYIVTIFALLIWSYNTSWAQENAEERLNEIIDQQEQVEDLKILKKAWDAYKLKDYEIALGLWMPLAEMGNPSAQVFIGLMYNQGNAVKQDRIEAAKWYTLASEQDYTPAKWRLAMLYYHGAGLTQSYQKAANLYHSAARRGDAYSQKALGVMYSQGFGVPKDNIMSYSWLHISSSNGFELAHEYQKKIAKNMSPEEIIIAEAMAKDCKHSNYENCGWASKFNIKPTEDAD